jgi:hypothetical protein
MKKKGKLMAMMIFKDSNKKIKNFKKNLIEKSMTEREKLNIGLRKELQ